MEKPSERIVLRRYATPEYFKLNSGEKETSLYGRKKEEKQSNVGVIVEVEDLLFMWISMKVPLKLGFCICLAYNWMNYAKDTLV